MLDFITLGMVFVMAQVVACLIMTYVTFKLLTNEKFMIKYTKKIMDIMEKVTEDLVSEIEKKL